MGRRVEGAGAKEAREKKGWERRRIGGRVKEGEKDAKRK